jgi:hypothetical protein
MNSVMTSSAQRIALRQPERAFPSAGLSLGAPAFELSRVYGERSVPSAKPARRIVSIAIAIAIQAAFVVGIISAMGVKMPTRSGPLMVVNITTQEIKPEDAPPPPPVMIQPPTCRHRKHL